MAEDSLLSSSSAAENSPLLLSPLVLATTTIAITTVFLKYYWSDQRRMETALAKQGIPARYRWSLPFVGHVEQFWDYERLLLESFDQTPPLSYFTLFGDVLLIIGNVELSTRLWPKFQTWDKCAVFYSMLDVLFGTNERTLLTQIEHDTDPQWQCKRDLVSQAMYKDKLNQQLAPFIEVHVKDLCEQWLTQGHGIDVDHDLTALTLRVIIHFIFGPQQEDLTTSVQKIQKALQDVVDLAWTINTNPLAAIQQMIPETHAYQVTQNFRGCIRELIEKAKAKTKTTDKNCQEEEMPALIHAMLAQRWKPEILENEVMTLLFAGHDTTAHATAIALENCVNHPRVVQAIRQEYKDLVLPKKEDGATCFYNNMKWPMAAWKESLRLNPETAGGTIRLAPDDIHLSDDLVIPKGCAVLSPFWVYSSAEGNWGPDAKQFRPERFLPSNNNGNNNNNNNNNVSNSTCPRKYIPFSQGKRNCVGMPLAYMEGSMLLGYILEHLDITIEAPAKKVFKVTVRVEDFTISAKRRQTSQEQA
ncbi:dihydroxyvitamin D(3) 24-hydroxylase, mitochondrial [Seminavis robusta]|uniref:Dihydroxyvitamin D(3) 24-hydroxylase, mitochondrial n=1 Tax=Seminavis robusta TaxID=568900 RepID=A0A9N8HAE2_9STRA|nr:dihydroxyvitamin D(3) 24-hydroxylase, mitochondrial [Seminavis robusta]|eukprot:Sro293_g109800.1 dihydroxyvitamin D(3) 24-hydroxylase, mitochondrial (530) ;mRNA; r:13488-15077